MHFDHSSGGSVACGRGALELTLVAQTQGRSCPDETRQVREKKRRRRSKQARGGSERSNRTRAKRALLAFFCGSKQQATLQQRSNGDESDPCACARLHDRLKALLELALSARHQRSHEREVEVPCFSFRVQRRHRAVGGILLLLVLVFSQLVFS
ncbi:hypothetical protein V8C34DRAFT_275292 [Trichoderma compactum]